MARTRILTNAGILTAVAVLLQIAPAILSEAFVLITAFSAVPIYLVSKVHPRIGLISCIITAILVFPISSHEAVLFLCTNGPVGLVLGMGKHKNWARMTTSLVGGAVLTIALLVATYVVGVPVFGTMPSWPLVVQVAFIALFSAIYCTFFLRFAEFVENRVTNTGVRY